MFSKMNKHYPPFLELIPICLLIFAWSYAIGQYNNLPASIPTHFGFSGTADDWSTKGFLSVYLMPLIATIIYLMDFGINIAVINSKDPRKFINLPIDKNTIIDEKMLESIRTSTVRFMYAINLLIIALFTYIQYESIQTGLGKANGVGSISVGIFIAAITMLCVTFTIKVFKMQKEAVIKK